MDAMMFTSQIDRYITMESRCHRQLLVWTHEGSLATSYERICPIIEKGNIVLWIRTAVLAIYSSMFYKLCHCFDVRHVPSNRLLVWFRIPASAPSNPVTPIVGFHAAAWPRHHSPLSAVAGSHAEQWARYTVRAAASPSRRGGDGSRAYRAEAALYGRRLTV